MDTRQAVKDVFTDIKTAEAITETARGKKGLPLLLALLENPRAVAFIAAACFLGGIIGMYIVTRTLSMFS